MLNCQHHDALRHEVVNHVALPSQNHQKWSLTVLSQTATLKVVFLFVGWWVVDGRNAHSISHFGLVQSGANSRVNHRDSSSM